MSANNLNQLAVWLKMAGDGIQVKKFPEGYPYMNKGILQNSTILKPVYRYAKNYDIEGQTKSLCMITQDSNIQEVEKWMDNRAKKITLEDVKRPFTLLDIYY